MAAYAQTNGLGFNYERNNTISGWRDAVALQPNDQTNPRWNYNSGISGCEWRQTENWGCSVGTQTQNGEHNRTHTSSTLGQTPVVSDWNLVRPALCEETRSSSVLCPVGQTGTITTNERRIFTSNAPGQGAWADWAITSSPSNCETISNDRDSNNSDSERGFDVDGDGQADFNSYSEARDYAEDNGLDVSAGGDIDTVSNECSGRCDGPDDGGNDSSSESTVLCTYFYKQGVLSRAVYVADTRYAQQHIGDHTKNGYHYWAVPLVSYLQKQHRPVAEPILKYIVKGWANEMAFQMGVIEKRPLRGRIIRMIGEPICNIIGRMTGKKSHDHLWHGV